MKTLLEFEDGLLSLVVDEDTYNIELVGESDLNVCDSDGDLMFTVDPNITPLVEGEEDLIRLIKFFLKVSKEYCEKGIIIGRRRLKNELNSVFFDLT